LVGSSASIRLGQSPKKEEKKGPENKNVFGFFGFAVNFYFKDFLGAWLSRPSPALD
jgi:hypothetical protein